MSSRKLWGEGEEEEFDENLLHSVSFNPIIELGMQNIPEISITLKTSPIELPQSNLVTHTIQLHAYSRQLSAILEQAEGNENAVIDPTSLPTPPPDPLVKTVHETTAPINFVPKTFNDFSLGRGPVILPFTQESHKLALRQSAAIAIAHVGIATCTNSALTALADTLDVHMTNLAKSMRTAADREASGLKSGYPDIMLKVLTDANVGSLHDFYRTRVVDYHAMIALECKVLRVKCERLAKPEIAPVLKLEEVPEIHFPAALDGAFTPSLEPGFQMLHSLEQEQLQGLELLDAVPTEDKKNDTTEIGPPEKTAKLSFMSPSTSSIAKKKKK